VSPEHDPYAPPKTDLAQEDVRPGEPPAALLDGPRGIGGWLILPLLGLIFTPIRMVTQMVRDFFPVLEPETWKALTTPGREAYHWLWAPTIVFELVTNLGLIGFTLVVLVLFVRTSRRVPKLMIALMLANIGIQGGDYVLVGLIPALASQPDTHSTRDLVRAVLSGAIWIPYFLVSKRVRNTFVK
jgi:hypothetical protein